MPLTTSYPMPFKVQEKRPYERVWRDHGVERGGQFEIMYFGSEQDAQKYIVTLMPSNQLKSYRVVDTRRT